jgi:hypothetical protein
MVESRAMAPGDAEARLSVPTFIEDADPNRVEDAEA